MRATAFLRYGEYAFLVSLAGFAAFGVASYATGAQPFLVETDNPSSMSNSINYGDVVLTYKVPFSSVGVGSVIVFHDPRGNPGIVLHRVVEVESCRGERCLSTKGDNDATNPTTDPWNVTEAYYTGEVLAVMPLVGYLSPAMYGLTGIYGLLPVVLIVLVLITYSTLRRRNETSRLSPARDGQVMDRLA